MTLLRSCRENEYTSTREGNSRETNRYQAVVIGGSSGGLEALQEVLAPLPPGFGLPIIVVLHRDPTSRELLAHLVDHYCRLVVKEANEKESIRPGVVYIAPANYHLLVELDRTLSLSVDPRVCYARPSIDVLFETAADAYRSGLVGILLTGGNYDGTDGLRRIKAQGGLTVVQDPTNARAAMMPHSAIQAGVVDHVLSLEEIAALLANAHPGKDIRPCGLPEPAPDVARPAGASYSQRST
jgi:two-component system chemotaxis response regulator CheB